MGDVDIEIPAGTVLAGYQVERVLGRGATGTVYLARDEALDRPVALKLLASDLARDARFRERFLRESRMAAGLEHPGIVPIYAAGEAHESLFLAMRRVDGDLRERIDREGRLELEPTTAVIEQVAAALDAAHQAGLIHRDVKPGNILVEGDRAWLSDFGLAKHAGTVNSLTRDSGFAGTVDYIAPEQIQGAEVDGRADVYALGCVLFEALTGRAPFPRDNDLAVIFAHLREPPPSITALRPDLPPALDRVVAKAMAKNPDERYASCAEVAAETRSAAGGGEVAAAPAGAAILRTFLICDVRGYTRYTQQHGDEAAAELAATFAKLVKAAVSAHDGRLIELRGDEALVVFESARSALRAALAIQEAVASEGLARGVGIGLDAGEAVPVGTGYRGGALNTAARLCSIAGPGQVLASETVTNLARKVDGVRYLHGRLERLKGLGKPVRVVEVVPVQTGDALRRRLQRRTRGRRWPLSATAVVLVAAAAVAAFVVIRSGSESTTLDLVSGDHVAAIDAAGLTLDGQYAVGATPTSVAGAGDVVYTVNADGQTISRVWLETGESVERGLPSPSDLAYDDGTLWVSSIDRGETSFTASLLDLDPESLEVRRETALPGVSREIFSSVPIAVGDGAIYAAAPSGRLVRVDASTLDVTQGPDLRAEAIAVGEGGVWAVTRGIKVVELDPVTLERRRSVELPAKTGIDKLAVGAGSVWGAEPSSGLLWRIHPEPPVSARSVSVGLSASDVTFGAGAVWVASGIDGAVIRFDPESEKMRRVTTGNAPQHIAVVGRRVLVTVAGARTDLVATRTDSSPGLATLPSTACRAVVYGGEGNPDVLIASDLSFQGLYAEENRAMVQAIEYTLRRHSFRAGEYRVGYQSCDDTTASSGFADEGKCEANAKSYVATESVLAVIGSFYSGCASAMLPILNAAEPSPLALVSPANSYTGLTRDEPGNTEGDPERYYRDGPRNFFRVYPADVVQGDTDAQFAESLGITRPFVYMADTRDAYQILLANRFRAAAEARGLDPVGPLTPKPGPDRFKDLAERLRKQSADGAFLASYSDDPRLPWLLKALRSEFGHSFPIIMPDSGLGDLPRFAGRWAAGVYASGAQISDPFEQLPPNGKRFVLEFSATQPDRDVNTFAPYTAQATEVVLAAIARSDGTRASVLEELAHTRVENGILGSFEFDENGDMTRNLMPIFRVSNDPADPEPYRFVTIVELDSPT